MKAAKKFLSVASAAAMLLTVLLSVMAIPATAVADGTNVSMMPTEQSQVTVGTTNTGSGSWELANGTLTIHSTDTDATKPYRIEIRVPTTYDMSVLTGLQLDINSTVAWKMAWQVQDVDATKTDWPNTGSLTSFFPADGVVADAAQAGEYSANVPFGSLCANTGAMTSVKFTQAIILVKGAGTFVLSGMTAMPYAEVIPTGAAATPNNPIYAHAATAAPTVTSKVDILAACGKTDNSAHTGWEAFGTWNNSANYLMPSVDLTKTPYLYYSVSQYTASGFTFGMYGNSPWMMFRDGSVTDAPTMDPESGNYSAAKWVYGAQTGCIDMRNYVGAGYQSAYRLGQLTLYGGSSNCVINYMFFGSAPVGEVVTTTTTTTASRNIVERPNLMPAASSDITISGGTMTYEDGQLVVNATGACTVQWPVNIWYNIDTYPNVYFCVGSTAASGFNITWNSHGTGTCNASITGDWAPGWNTAALVYGQKQLGFRGSPNWNKVILADGTYFIDSIKVDIASAGTFTLDTMVMSDTAPATTTTTTQTRYTWDSSFNMAPLDAAKWGSVDASGSAAVVTVSEGKIELSNTAGSWPAAVVTYDTPISVDQAKSAIRYDFQTLNGGSTNITMFFGTDTPTSYGSNYITVTNVLTGADDATGHYSGYLYLSDLDLPAGCYDAAGNVKITGLKVFAVGDAGNTLVEISDFTLVYVASEVSTTASTTTTLVPEVGTLLPAAVSTWVSDTPVTVSTLGSGYRFASSSETDWANSYYNDVNMMVNVAGNSIHYDLSSVGQSDVILYFGDAQYVTLGYLIGNMKYNITGDQTGEIPMSAALTYLAGKYPTVFSASDTTLTFKKVRAYVNAGAQLDLKSLFVAPAKANESVTLAAANVTKVIKDDIISVTVSVDSTTGVCNFDGPLVYDANVLQPVQVNGNYAVKGAALDANGMFTSSVASGTLKVGYADVKNSAATGELFTAYFKVLTDKATTVSVGFAPADIQVAYYDNGPSYAPDTALVNGQVSIQKSFTATYDLGLGSSNPTEQVRVASDNSIALSELTYEAPTKAGQTFDTWYITSIDTINQTVTVKAAYTIVAPTDKYTVQAVNAQFINGTDGTNLSYNDVVVMEPVVPDGAVFDYWSNAMTGEIVSTEETLTVLVCSDLYFEANFRNQADPATEMSTNVSLQAVLEDNGNITFVAKFGMADGDTIQSFGIVYAPGTVTDEALRDEANQGTTTAKVQAGQNSSTDQYSVTVQNVANGKTRKAVAYITVKHADGTIETYYSTGTLSATSTKQ